MEMTNRSGWQQRNPKQRTQEHPKQRAEPMPSLCASYAKRRGGGAKMSEIDEQIAEVNAKITDVLRHPSSANAGDKTRLAEESIRLTNRKITGRT